MTFIAPPIRWQRYPLPHPSREKREWTARRLAAARRRVQIEKDKVALFPEMARYQTVEERVKDIDAGEAALREDMRKHHADLWRRARRLLRSLPRISQVGILLYWNEAGYPPDPLYFLQTIKDAQHVSAWRKLRGLRMLHKIGNITDPARRATLVNRLPRE